MKIIPMFFLLIGLIAGLFLLLPETIEIKHKADNLKTECEKLGGEYAIIRQHLNQPLVFCFDKKAILFKKGTYNES